MKAGGWALVVAIVATAGVIGYQSANAGIRDTLGVGPARKDVSAEQVGPQDVRKGWHPGRVKVMRPVRFGMVGCDLEYIVARPFNGVKCSRKGPRGNLLILGPSAVRTGGGATGTSFLGRSCQPPSRGRPWWKPVQRKYIGDTWVDTEYLDLPESKWQGTGVPVSATAVTYGTTVYTLAQETENWVCMGVQGGQLWVGVDGWFAVDSRGRDIRNPVITYDDGVSGPKPVTAAPWPGAVAPWKGVAESSNPACYAALRGERDDFLGITAPDDACACVYAWALASRPRLYAESAA